MTSTTAARAVRSIRNDRVAPIRMEVRASETVRDGFEASDLPTAETAVHDPATGRFYELTARQMTAIHLLTMGKSVVATAKSLEIGVSTLHRWKSKQPAFIAELNRRKTEVFEHTVDKLRSTMAKAVDELWSLMQSNNRRDRYEVAMKLLPMMQPRKWIVPTGPSDPDGVVEEQIREKRLARGEEAKSEITEEEREAVIAEAEAAISSPRPSRSPLRVLGERVRVRVREQAEAIEGEEERAERPSPQPSPGVPGEGAGEAAAAGHPEERSDEGPRPGSCEVESGLAPEILRRHASQDDNRGPQTGLASPTEAADD